MGFGYIDAMKRQKCKAIEHISRGEYSSKLDKKIKARGGDRRKELSKD